MAFCAQSFININCHLKDGIFQNSELLDIVYFYLNFFQNLSKHREFDIDLINKPSYKISVNEYNVIRKDGIHRNGELAIFDKR